MCETRSRHRSPPLLLCRPRLVAHDEDDVTDVSRIRTLEQCVVDSRCCGRRHRPRRRFRPAAAINDSGVRIGDAWRLDLWPRRGRQARYQLCAATSVAKLIDRDRIRRGICLDLEAHRLAGADAGARREAPKAWLARANNRRLGGEKEPSERDGEDSDTCRTGDAIHCLGDPHKDRTGPEILGPLDVLLTCKQP